MSRTYNKWYFAAVISFVIGLLYLYWSYSTHYVVFRGEIVDVNKSTIENTVAIVVFVDADEVYRTYSRPDNVGKFSLKLPNQWGYAFSFDVGQLHPTENWGAEEIGQLVSFTTPSGQHLQLVALRDFEDPQKRLCLETDNSLYYCDTKRSTLDMGKYSPPLLMLSFFVASAILLTLGFLSESVYTKFADQSEVAKPSLARSDKVVTLMNERQTVVAALTVVFVFVAVLLSLSFSSRILSLTGFFFVLLSMLLLLPFTLTVFMRLSGAISEGRATSLLRSILDRYPILDNQLVCVILRAILWVQDIDCSHREEKGDED